MSPRSGFAVTVAVLAAVNVVGIRLPGWAYLPANLAALLVLLALARRAGASADDVGLRRDRLSAGLRFGAVLGAALVAVIVIGALVPALRSLYEDQRAGGIGVAGLLYQAAVRIPVGTALFEEVAFRGVLLGLGRRAWGRTSGALLSAVLFGLWHIAPALDVVDGNAGLSDRPAALVVVLSVGATAVAGLFFSWMRDRSDSLAAPVVAHAAVNAAAFTAAWVIL